MPVRSAVRPALTAGLVATLLLLVATAPTPALESGTAALPSSATCDLARAAYEDYDAAFVRHWQARTGERLRIDRSTEPGCEALAVAEGSLRKPVALAPVFEIDALRAQSLPPPAWQRDRTHGGVPYRTTVVFLVRDGNPHDIHDWSDLVDRQVKVVSADPASSASGHWNRLGARAYALRASKGDDAAAGDFVDRLFGRQAILESNASAAVNRFVNDSAIDVLVVQEDVAHRLATSSKVRRFEVVAPSVSVLVQPRVAVLDRVTLSPRSRELARAWVEFLYTSEGQAVLARNHLRPLDDRGAFHGLPPLETVMTEASRGMTVVIRSGAHMHTRNRHSV